MNGLQYCKLNEELLAAIRNEEFLGTQHRKGTKVTFIYSYSLKLMRFIIDTKYRKCGEYVNLPNYGNCIRLCLNLKDVPKDLLLELANLPHAKGWKHIREIQDNDTRILSPVGKSEYLFKDECNRFYVKP